MSDVDPAKRAAGVAAASHVDDGMRLGLGTGSTVAYFLDELARRGLDVAGMPTSEATAQRCRELGIRLLQPGDASRLDVCIDGADELDHDLQLTKGGGGALLREKVVAALADRMIVIATPDKVVDRLGDTFAIPVEVIPFAVPAVTRVFQSWSAEPHTRGDGEYRTDNGNAIIDVRIPGGLEDPAAFEAQAMLIPGVAEVGLFIDLADLAILGRGDGAVEELRATT